MKSGLYSTFSFFGIALSVSNINRSIEWYQEVLGFKLISKTDFDAIQAKGAFMQGPGLRLEFLQTANAYRIEEMFAAPPAHLNPIGNKSLILHVDDLTQLSAYLHQRNVEILWEQLVINQEGMKNTMIKDIDGNFISIFEKKEK